MPLIDKVEFVVISGKATIQCRIIFIEDDGTVVTRDVGEGRDIEVHGGDTVNINFDGVDERIKRVCPLEDIQSVDNVPEDRKEPQIRKLKI